MRDRTKLFSFALCALLMLGFASAAQAQVLWNTTFTNNQVVHYGLTELMGEVRFTSVSGTTQGSTITVTYLGAAITNTLASGIAIDTASGGVTVSWSGQTFRLQGSERVQGPWFELGAESPVQLPATSTARFFRLFCD